MATANQHKKESQHRQLSVSDWHSYRTLFRENRQFGRLWLAGLISQGGNWFNYIAIFVLLTRLTDSGHAVSWFLIAKFLPTTLFGPAAGVVADRLPRKVIMIASDLIRAAIVLGFLLVKSPDQVWIVYLLALLQETLWTFSDPARRASIPNLCRPHELNLANALGGATWSLMLAVGAAAGGFVTAALGWQAAILLDSLTFLVSAFLLRRLILPPPPTEKKEKATWKNITGLSDLAEGVAYLANHRNVAALLLVKSGWALSGGILVLLTFFGEQVFTVAGEGNGSGILYSIRGVGAVIGPILAWRLLGENRRAMYRSIGLAFFLASISYMLFSKAPGLLWAVPCVLFGHIGGSVQWVFSTNLLQRIVPDQFRGRVFAAEMALFTLIISLSTYFTGAALDTDITPQTIAFTLGALFLIPGTLWTLYCRISGQPKK